MNTYKIEDGEVYPVPPPPISAITRNGFAQKVHLCRLCSYRQVANAKEVCPTCVELLKRQSKINSDRKKVVRIMIGITVAVVLIALAVTAAIYR